MEIEFVAFDSFGVKSMCTFVKTKDITICIDPGIAEETNSFPLSLTKRMALVAFYTLKIMAAVRNADIVVITHYHYDHHIPEGGMYKDKILLIKDPKKNINRSQRGRAAYFLEQVKGKAKEIKVADGNVFKFGKTKIKFSKAVWHGLRGTNLGKVVMVSINDGKQKLLFTSDLDGPYEEEYVNAIAREKPSVLILDGHPSYLLGYLASLGNLRRVIKNTIKILKWTNCDLYIIDHHLLRDYRYREIYYEVYKAAKKMKKNVKTVAEVIGKTPKVIEAYNKNGPTRWKEWEPYTFESLDKMIKHAKGVAKKKSKRKAKSKPKRKRKKKRENA